MDWIGDFVILMFTMEKTVMQAIIAKKDGIPYLTSNVSVRSFCFFCFVIYTSFKKSLVWFYFRNNWINFLTLKQIELTQMFYHSNLIQYIRKHYIISWTVRIVKKNCKNIDLTCIHLHHRLTQKKGTHLGYQLYPFI